MTLITPHNSNDIIPLKTLKFQQMHERNFQSQDEGESEQKLGFGEGCKVGLSHRSHAVGLEAH